MHCVLTALRRVLEPSELQVQVVASLRGCWEPNLGPRQKQQVLLTTGLSLQPPDSVVLDLKYEKTSQVDTDGADRIDKIFGNIKK